MEYALRRASGFMYGAFPLLVPVAVVIAVAVGIWQLVVGISNWQRGIYAGMHFADARTSAQNVMVARYGHDTAAKMRFATPPVVNTHSTSLLSVGQVRVFHIIGPRGVKYCVSIWGPRYLNVGHVNIGANYKLQKNCSF